MSKKILTFIAIVLILVGIASGLLAYSYSAVEGGHIVVKICLIATTVFLTLGCILLFSKGKQSKKDIEWLLNNGTAIDAELVEVKKIGGDMHSRTFGNFFDPTAWIITVQGKNPISNSIEKFTHRTVIFNETDPKSNIKTPIKVYIDPHNPEHYYVDVAFLQIKKT